MDTTRQNKFARMIQKELADLFQKEGKNIYGSAFVTLTHVKVTPDLALARIYLSIFKHKDTQSVIQKLKGMRQTLRKKLAERIKNQARHIPELEFFLDESLEQVEKMEAIMKNLHIPPAEE